MGICIARIKHLTSDVKYEPEDRMAQLLRLDGALDTMVQHAGFTPEPMEPRAYRVIREGAPPAEDSEMFSKRNVSSTCRHRQR